VPSRVFQVALVPQQIVRRPLTHLPIIPSLVWQAARSVRIRRGSGSPGVHGTRAGQPHPKRTPRHSALADDGPFQYVGGAARRSLKRGKP
jgi:hypothetical protein